MRPPLLLLGPTSLPGCSMPLCKISAIVNVMHNSGYELWATSSQPHNGHHTCAQMCVSSAGLCRCVAYDRMYHFISHADKESLR